MTQGASVAFLRIVVLHPLPSLQFPSDDTQQVVTEGLAIAAFDDERFVGRCLDSGQRFGMGQRLIGISLTLGGRVFTQLGVLLVDDREHSVIDGLQRHMGNLLFLLFQPTDGRSQRVGSHLSLQTGVEQGRLQQLAVSQFLSSLLLYLLQMFDSGLGQVLLLRFLNLFPQRLIGMTEESYDHDHHQHHNDDYSVLHTRFLNNVRTKVRKTR